MRVVSLRLRLLAAFIDALVALAGMAAVVGAGIAGATVYNRVRGGDGAADGEEGSGEDEHVTRRSRRSRQLRRALWGASAGLAIAGRNWRSPGFRLIGLRRVDAQTGEGVTVRSALIGVLFDQAWQAAWKLPFRSRAKRHQTRLRALAQQLKAVERENGSDRQAHSQARTKFYESNSVNPAGGCGWLVAGPLVSQLVLAVSSREGRTIRDRITGTGVIADR